MTSHLGLMVLFALFVSIVFATITQDDPAAQVRAGARLFGGFVAAGLVLGWVLFFFPL